VRNNVKHPQIDLLLTRPKAGSDSFWDALSLQARQRLNPIISPLIKIVPLVVEQAEFETVIFSSVNGVKNAPNGAGRTAYCVGAMTTSAALAAGWHATQMGETANQLVARIVKENVDGQIAHLGGTHTRGEIAQRLTSSGLTTVHLAVYDQKLCNLTEQAKDALSSRSQMLVPLFSPRSALRFSDKRSGRDGVHIIAISQEVADQINDNNWGRITVLARPTRLAMLDAVEKAAVQFSLG
jgi:uroporphyrinogen-III synthase